MLQSSVSSESAPTTLSQRPFAPDDESKAKGWLSAEATASGAAGSKDTTSATAEAVGASETVQRLQDTYDEATDPGFWKKFEKAKVTENLQRKIDRLTEQKRIIDLMGSTKPTLKMQARTELE